MSEFIIVRPEGPQGTRPIQVARRLDQLALAGKLIRHADPVSTWVWESLSEATQNALGAPNLAGIKPALWVDLLIADLNRISKGPAVYDSIRFQDVKLPPATRTLLGSNPSGNDLVCLNRLVLAGAFQELRPNVLMDGGWLGKTDTIVFVGTPGVHRLTVDLPGAEATDVTIQNTSAVRPLEVSIRWDDPASASCATQIGEKI